MSKQPLSLTDPTAQAKAMADLEVGQVVQYTEQANAVKRAKKDHTPRVRAAVVIFVLDDGTERRPVLRVMMPAQPPLPGMPDEGRVMAATGLTDIEVYGPTYHPDATQENTWRPLSSAE